MKDKLLIIGASGHGKVVADIALKMNKWEKISFLDNNKNIKSSLGIEVIGKSSDMSKYIQDWDIFVAIGDNSIRKKIQEKLEFEGASIPTLIHPTAVIGEQVELASGTVVMAGVIINSSTKVNKGCIINTSSTVDHDNVIGNYVHISPGVNIAGTVRIGYGSWIGIGASVSNNISITNNCKIGAGALVVKNLTEPGTYIGIPVRRV